MNTNRLVVIGLLAGCCLIPAVLSAQTPLGSEFQVNTYTTNTQKFPALSADGDGNFVVVWHSGMQDGDYFGVFGQRYDSAGSALGTEFQVNSYTTAYQGFAVVSADSDGDFVVVWTSSNNQDGDDYGVFGQRFDSAGNAVGTEFQVNTYTTDDQGGGYAPAVSADSDGDFVVVWSSRGQDGPSFGIFGQRYDSAGSAAGTEFRVNSYTTGYQGDPAVSADSDGNFVVVWMSDNQDGDDYGVFGQRYDSAGSAVGTEFQVNTYITSSQYRPDVSADSDGDFVVVWQSGYQDGYGIGVFGQRFDGAGAVVGTEFQANSYTIGYQGHPKVSADSDGDFVVVWHSFEQDGSFYGVFGQRFTSAGAPEGPEFRVNTYTTSDQKFPVVSTDSVGNFVVAWARFSDGSSYGVFAQRFSPDTPMPGTETATPTTTPTPSITPTSTLPPGGVCPATPLPSCTEPGKSILIIKDAGEDGAGLGDKLIWKWIKGPATDQSDFGDPTATASYTFCVYSGLTQALTIKAEVPAAGTCGGGNCWSAISTKGYKRKDKSASTDGIALILLKGGAAGGSKIIVKGKDAALDLDASTLPLSEAANVVAQLSNSDNTNCWQGTFSAMFKKNTDAQFKAKAP